MLDRRKLLSNKKGDIPIVILVIGVFAVCTLTLLNFYVKSFKDDNLFEGVILIEKVRELSEDLKFYNNPSLNKKNALELTGLSGEGIEEGNFKFKGEFIPEKRDIGGKLIKKASYKIEGNLTEDTIIFEGKRLVSVKYNFNE